MYRLNWSLFLQMLASFARYDPVLVIWMFVAQNGV